MVEQLNKAQDLESAKDAVSDELRSTQENVRFLLPFMTQLYLLHYIYTHLSIVLFFNQFSITAVQQRENEVGG